MVELETVEELAESIADSLNIYGCPIRYSATNYPVKQGTLLHTLKSVVSATPAPHGVLRYSIPLR